MESLSVGDVAGRLGVTPSTVRMWGSRYGLTASLRSAGGHRRYTAADVDRLQQMHDAVITGMSPALAAARALAGGPVPALTVPSRGGPGGAVLALGNAGPDARGLARAASRLDENGLLDILSELLPRTGTLTVWNDVVRPVLVAAGNQWHRTGSGIEVEHVLTQAVTTAFTRYVADLPDFAQVDPVLLAGAPQEDHVLALHAVRSALAERGVPTRFLGPRTPLPVLASAARRTRAPAVLIWSSLPDPSAPAGLILVRTAHRRMEVFLGGPGWAGAGMDPAEICASLDAAVTGLERAWTGRRGAGATRTAGN